MKKGDRAQETRESGKSDGDGKSDVKRTENQDRGGNIKKEEIKEHVGVDGES